jgi:hypothetical protein
MGIVDFDHEIGERKLQLMGPQPPGLTLRRLSCSSQASIM